MSFGLSHYDFSDKARAYADLARDLEGLLEGERHWIANTANAAALLYAALPDLNWAGFYLVTTSARQDERVPRADLRGTDPGAVARRL